jgi:Copper type II ascorbate-dependent monooxygenase, C-terminal domain
MKELRLASVVLLVLVAACGDDDDGGGGNVDASAIDGGGGVDADLGDWLVLNEGSWTIPPGGDTYYCIIKTIQEDTYIRAFKGLIPYGTHHTVLTIYDGPEPDGIVPCNAGVNGPNMIYGTGVGTPPMELPAGVAVKLTKGQKIINNLHLFNAGETPISGTSGTLYKPMASSEMKHEAEVVLAGPTISLVVPQGESTQTGKCTISNITNVPIQVFSVAPHMHKLGTHMKSTIIRGQDRTVIQDVAYTFESQTFELRSPTIELRPGDLLQTDCTYKNTTDHTVTFGDSSNDEMCFTDIYYYPKQGARFICTN